VNGWELLIVYDTHIDVADGLELVGGIGIAYVKRQNVKVLIRTKQEVKDRRIEAVPCGTTIYPEFLSLYIELLLGRTRGHLWQSLLRVRWGVIAIEDGARIRRVRR